MAFLRTDTKKMKRKLKQKKQIKHQSANISAVLKYIKNMVQKC